MEPWFHGLPQKAKLSISSLSRKMFLRFGPLLSGVCVSSALSVHLCTTFRDGSVNPQPLSALELFQLFVPGRSDEAIIQQEFKERLFNEKLGRRESAFSEKYRKGLGDVLYGGSNLIDTSFKSASNLFSKK